MHDLFTYKVEEWYRLNGRDLPWRKTKNPYHIWLSEVILQQTRVEQGRDYYTRFLETYPTVERLASASEEEVMRLWQGLGYYTRARNLHAAAKEIVRLGCFPKEYKDVLRLPGVGPYTAAAIVSFAYGEAKVVVDGNVYRVLARYFGIDTPIDSNSGKKEFQAMAEEMLDENDPALFNQAIMDFGAVVCKPSAPLCDLCPLAETCVALSQHKATSYPVKEKKINVINRFFTYIYIRTVQGEVLIQKRDSDDIWKGLFQFPLFESDRALSLTQLRRFLPEGTLQLVTKNFEHQLTHQRLHTDFYVLTLVERMDKMEGMWIQENDVEKYAMPQLLVRLLQKLQSVNFGR